MPNTCRLLIADARWNEVVVPCSLPRRPTAYDRIADEIDRMCDVEATSATITVSIARSGFRCLVMQQRILGEWQDVERDWKTAPITGLLLSLCRASSYPLGTGWCALDLSFDMSSGDLRACLRYGYDDDEDSRYRFCTRDLLMEPAELPEIVELIRASLS